LENHTFFKNRAQLSVRRGTVPDQNVWGGWLAQYYAHLSLWFEKQRAHDGDAPKREGALAVQKPAFRQDQERER
jgi:hypothetical protein